MINIIFIILLVVSMLSGFIPLSYGIKYYKTFSIQLKVLFFYLLFSVITEGIIFVLTAIKLSGYNSSVQFTFTLIEFFAIIYVYWREFNKPPLKIAVMVAAILFIIGLAISYVVSKNLAGMIDLVDIIEASIIIIFSIIFFFKVLTDLQIPKLTDYPFFWLNSAFLMYFGTVFFLFLFNNTAKEFDQPIVYFLAVIHHIMNITYNILITIALCKVRKT